MDVSRTASYVLEDKLHRRVVGWLNEGAISAVIAFAKWQEDNNVFGDVAEIGVHHGKFFILLANLRRDHERAFAVDVFEDQQLNPDRSGRGNLSIFKKNLGLYADTANVDIIQKDSKRLSRADFYQGKKDSIRLISIDGSHTATHTASDLALSVQLLASNGLIILDDFYNPDWPGVQEGFYRFLANSFGDIAPVAYGNNKLYLCRRASHVRYLALVENSLRPHLLHYKRVEIGGYSAVHLSLPSPEVVFQPDFCLIPNVFPLCRPTAPGVTLGEGWAAPQENGVWTMGARSELNLKPAPVSKDAPILRLDLEPFLHQERTSRRLGITVNDCDLGEFVFDKAGPKSLMVEMPRGTLPADCRLQFDIEGPDRPSETIGTNDQRPLGFFFNQIRII